MFFDNRKRLKVKLKNTSVQLKTANMSLEKKIVTIGKMKEFLIKQNSRIKALEERENETKELIKELNVVDNLRQMEAAIEKRTAELTVANSELKQKQQEIERELALARIIQQNLLPGNFYQHKNIRVDSYYRPVSDLGGDIYDVLKLDENKIAVLLADVSGHGLPAALIAMMVKLSFISSANSRLTPAQVVERMNHSLCRCIGQGNYITAVYILIDCKSMNLTYTNAGHHPIVRTRPNDGAKLLSSGGPVLGVLADAAYDCGRLTLQSGDRFFIYSDGLIEERNSAGQEYGHDRLVEKLTTRHTEPLSNLIETILSDITTFKEQASTPKDDITFMGIEIEPTALKRNVKEAAQLSGV